MKYLLFTIAIFFAIACNDDCEHPIDSACYSFDIRQCQTDLFADEIPETDSKSERETKMKNWLKDQDVFVENINLVIGFHEAVCEACHVCPQGDRYFIQVFGTAEFSTLELLNLEEEACCDIF